MASSSKESSRDNDGNNPIPTSSSYYASAVAGSSRNFGASTSGGGHTHKKRRYSYNAPHINRDKARLAESFLGFEQEALKPVFRKSLDVDQRFFPIGIQPGTILEIKGPEKSGKTFLLTYFIARVLTVYADNKVVFIDTRHKFSVKNVISVLCNFDDELKACISHGGLCEPLPTVLENHPKIASYLDRIMVISCYTPENLFFTFGPSGESQLQKMLRCYPNICLVAVDCIDEFSFLENLESSSWARNMPNIMDILRESVSETGCPVICTTLEVASKHAYWKRKNIPPPQKPESEGDTSMTGQEDDVNEKPLNNFTVDHSVFTRILELTPATEAEIAKLVHPHVKKISHCSTAYLRSKHSAKTAGSGENHRVKFSIFSDMLWVFN